MNKTLTKPFILVASLALSISGALTTFAGPEPIRDYSKEKNPIVEPVAICDPRWYISIGGDIELNFDSDFQRGVDSDDETFTGPGNPPAEIFVDLNSHDIDDVYENPFWSLDAEVGYVLNSHLELFVAFKYSHSGEDNSVHGLATFDNTRITRDFPFKLNWEDYSAAGFQVGFRWFFLSKEAKVRPYLSLAAGASHVDDIDLQIEADESSTGGSDETEVFNGNFYSDSWVGTVTGLVGVEFTVSCHFVLGVNAGIGYQTELDQSNNDLHELRESILASSGFDAAFLDKLNNGGGDRLYMPVSVYAKFRF